MSPFAKNSLKLLGIHALCFVLGAIAFVALFRSSAFHGIGVLFYRGIACIILVSVVMGAVLVLLKRARLESLLTYRDVVLAVVVFSCVTMVLFTHLPVTVERSVSVFVLGYMNERRGAPITVAEMRNVFVDKYIDENNAIQKRFDEQVASGNIARGGDGYVLTPAGTRLVHIFGGVADIFGISTRLIRP